MIIQHVDGICHCNGRCKVCFDSVSVAIRQTDYHKWQGGEYLQDAAPYLSVDDREFLISRVCGTCFDAMWEDTGDE